MKFQIMKNGFLGFDEGESFQAPYKKARAVIIPYGFEATVSYGTGTKNGPSAIIKASPQLEMIDPQTLKEPYKVGVATLKEPSIPKDPKKALQQLSEITGSVLDDGKFPIILGGEHSITPGPLASVAQRFKDISVLHFDAHMDMRAHYHGSEYSHASFMAQSILNLPIKSVTQVGIRNMSPMEKKFYTEHKNKISVFWAWQKLNPAAILKTLKSKNIYITFDVDVFDPSIMPSTGTPEPGGLFWWQTLDILRNTFADKNVIAADVVELAPIKNLHAPDFLSAS